VADPMSWTVLMMDVEHHDGILDYHVVIDGATFSLSFVDFVASTVPHRIPSS